MQSFLDEGEDFIVENDLDSLLEQMQKHPGGELLDLDNVRREVEARDREMENDFTKGRADRHAAVDARLPRRQAHPDRSPAPAFRILRRGRSSP